MDSQLCGCQGSAVMLNDSPRAKHSLMKRNLSLYLWILCSRPTLRSLPILFYKDFPKVSSLSLPNLTILIYFYTWNFFYLKVEGSTAFSFIEKCIYT